MKLFKSSGLIVLICLFAIRVNAQDALQYSYDAGGNLVQRQIQVLMQGRIGKLTTEKDSVYTFKVYPNPANQYLNIEGPLPEGKTSATLILTAVNGQILRQDNYTGQMKAIPVSDLKPGLYLLEIRYSKEKSTTYKIVISN